MIIVIVCAICGSYLLLLSLGNIKAYNGDDDIYINITLSFFIAFVFGNGVLSGVFT